MKRMSLYKTNSGIYHLGQTKQGSNPSVVSTAVLLLVISTYMISKCFGINEIKGVTVYIEDVDTIPWTEVQPETDFEYTEANKVEGLNRSKDNIGLFPIYFFVHNLKCEDLTMTLTL